MNVENCTMDIDIDTDKEYSAGFVGKNSGRLSFSGCTVEGNVYTSAKFAAGFVSETNASCNFSAVHSTDGTAGIPKHRFQALT
ncbi:hypothetical protein [Ruminococcus sp.]|uniref:hypothetical protein n=1 Tax=Ruminococcus sp. TaxID=41978 RepID=UPI002E75E298|nr:hypothetical protein [Ruminococcus sp.]MEE1261459.1 hypothetical protein [Ruminococcus sp.]